MKLAVVAALTATLAAPAHAEPEESSPKSETTALALSLGGTLASAGLMAYGLSRGPEKAGVAMFDVGLASALITPSLGHFYAGKVMTTGLVLRGAGAAIAAVGAAQSLGCWDNTCNAWDSGLVALGVGASVAAVGAIWDIATAPKAARDYNARHVRIAPIGPGGSIGLGFMGEF